MGDEVSSRAYVEDGHYLSNSHCNRQRNSSYEGFGSSLPYIDSSALHMAREHEHEHTRKLSKALPKRSA
jgi:hypothetical protein